MLAGLHRLDRERAVSVVPGGDEHGINAGVCEDPLNIVRHILAAELLAVLLGSLEVHVGEGMDLYLLGKRPVLLGDELRLAAHGRQMSLAHAATADDAQTYLVH